jgi:hypothetical protein
MYENLALLAGFVLLYSLVARGVERTWVSGPIVFTAFGLLIGPIGLACSPSRPGGKLSKPWRS